MAHSVNDTDAGQTDHDSREDGDGYELVDALVFWSIDHEHRQDEQNWNDASEVEETVSQYDAVETDVAKEMEW